MRFRLAAVSAAALFALCLPAFADDCAGALTDNDAWLRDNPDIRASLNSSTQLDLRELRKAAMILHSNGQDDTCEDVVDAMKSIANDAHDNAAEVEDNSVRTERLAGAVSLAAVPGVLRADELTGRDVRNMQDEDLGEVDDVVVATNEGGRSYAIISYGGFLGIGQEQVAVPLSVLAITEDRNILVLDMSKDAFEAAPRFDRDDMTSLNDAAWVETNDSYFAGNG